MDQQDLLVNTAQVWFIFITRTDVFWSASTLLESALHQNVCFWSKEQKKKSHALSVDKLVHQSDSGYVVESNAVVPLK